MFPHTGQDDFWGVVFGGRTGERKIYPQEITDEDGVYILMRVDEDVLLNGY